MSLEGETGENTERSTSTENTTFETPTAMPMGETTQPEQTGEAVQAGPPVETKRTQLRIVRENIDTLSRNVGKFRKSHELSTKKLEKQIVSLRGDLASMEKRIAKDAEKSRKKQEAALSRILAKVSAKPNKRKKGSKR